LRLRRHLTVLITKFYYLNLKSMAQLVTIINFTNPIWPTDIKEHYCIMRTIIIHQLGLKLNMVSPRVFVLWPLIFLILISDLPKLVMDKSVPILYADDTSISLSHSDPSNFNNNINTVFKILSEWFKQNLICLILPKPNLLIPPPPPPQQQQQ